MNKYRTAVHGFTLIEFIAGIVILGIIVANVFPRFAAVSDTAHDAITTAVMASLVSGHSSMRMSWLLAGQPGAGSTTLQNVVVDGITVRYRDGHPNTTTNSAHIPVGTPNRNTAQARLFFLFPRSPPQPNLDQTSTETGWVMLGTNAACAPVDVSGTNPRRCREYRVDGTRYARIT